MQNEMKKLRVYRLGSGYALGRDGQPVRGWPYMVSYAPEHVRGEFLMEEGDGRNGNGNFFHPQQILQPLWRSHLETAGVLWLVPLLERMAAGEKVGRREVFEAYENVHGSPPPADEILSYCD